MAEAEATIPENSESIPEQKENVPDISPEPAPAESKRGRGRPAGAKDRAPRTTKPKVRVEPIPKQVQPEPAAHPMEPVEARPPSPEPPPPSPEPPSPRTLIRQTSAHLLNLRDVMNSQKRTSAAERYTARLHAWPVV